MQTYPVDIDPGQVARWLKAECEVAPSTFKISARRRQEVREIPVRAETHLGDTEREDLTEIATIATLEIAPVHASDGWLLSVVVEDEVGPRVSNGGTGGEAEQQSRSWDLLQGLHSPGTRQRDRDCRSSRPCGQRASRPRHSSD